MNINSSEQDRYNELQNKNLHIISWDKTKEMIITDGEKSYSRSIKDFAIELNLNSTSLDMKDMDYPVKFTMNSIKESIKQTFDLTSLAKLFTVLKEVANNAILIEVEPYRHTSNPKSGLVSREKQYLSGFMDETYLYPVKITVEERHNIKDTYAYVTITVGKINKEALSITGIGYNPKAPSVGITSLDISIADFVKLFNREQSKILKNLPDGFLNEKQKGMKQKVIEHDNNIENKMNKIQSQIKNLQQDLADTKKEYYSSIQSEYDEYER